MIGNLPVLWTLSALTEILFTPLRQVQVLLEHSLKQITAILSYPSPTNV